MPTWLEFIRTLPNTLIGAALGLLTSNARAWTTAR
jgi:hypothetical protein